MQEIRINAAQSDDAKKLSALAFRSKAHWGYDAAFMQACREELSVPREAIESEIVRVATKGDAIAGFYRLSFDSSDCELEAMFIDPPYIGSGFGKALWNDMLTHAVGKRASRLVCQADPYAEGFYKRMGMKRIGERPSGSIPGRSLPMMAMKLPVEAG